MAIAKMKFAKVTGPLELLNNFISSCCLDGNLHPEQATQFMSASTGYTSLTETNPYAPMIQKIEELVKKNGSMLEPTIVDSPRDALLDDETAEYISDIDAKITAIHDEREQLEEQLKECRAGIEKFTHFTGFDVNLDELFNCEFIKIRFGHLPKEGYERLVAYNDNPYILFVPCSGDDAECWGLYCAPVDKIDEADRIFAGLNFERLRVPEAVGTVEEVVEQIEKNIEILEKSIEELDERAANSWNEQKTRFNILYTQLKDLNTVFEMRRYAAYHGKYFFYVCWIPAEFASSFEERAEAIEGIEVELDDPEKSSKISPPVKLKNPGIFKPYEYFVDMYGLPSYSDIDVTGFVAVTYTILFGIMFGDLGQGLVLFLLGILGWKIKKMPLARIIIPCGLSSMVFGFVFGSVFGYEEMLDPVYHALGWASKPLSVMESINTVLLFAIGIGVVLVVMAMLLNVYACIRRRHFGEAVFSQNGLVGIVLYLGGVAFCVGFMGGPQVLPNSVILPVMGVCAVLLYLKEIPIGIIDKHPDWKPDSAVDFLLQNLFELIEYILSYFSNTVSFLRVGAFVIVHASMMMVVFTLGAQGENIAVIVLGNIVVIALEGLLTGIQGLRLEFYEMFSRFYEGGGRPFEAVSLRPAQQALAKKNRKKAKSKA